MDGRHRKNAKPLCHFWQRGFELSESDSIFCTVYVYILSDILLVSLVKPSKARNTSSGTAKTTVLV